jgi:N-acetyl-anhydromuramyl-L-alanine amidase AmpD
MMIEVGREIVACWPQIGPDDHHGHHDICPGYKVDPIAFPFARVLAGIYPGRAIVDHWTPTRTVAQRQRALMAAGYDVGPFGADGSWGPGSLGALKRFQDAHGLVVNGYWSTFVSRRLCEVLAGRGIDIAESAGPVL